MDSVGSASVVSRLFDEHFNEDRKSDPGPKGSVLGSDSGEAPSEEPRLSDPGPKGSVLGSDFIDEAEAEFGDPGALAQVSSPDRQGGGDLFLTCFRLRFEERGSWTEASDLPAEARQGQQKEEGAAGGVPESSASESGPASSERARQTWKEWSGRERGNAGFRLDDLVLRPIAPLRRRYGRGTGPSFARCSANAKIAADGIEALLCDDATEHGIVVTAPLLSVSLGSGAKAPIEQGRGSEGARPSSSRFGSERFSSMFNKPAVELYYFEFTAFKVSPASTRSVMLGFCWDVPAQDSGSWPEFAEQLPRSFVVGGDNVNGWRPVIHIRSEVKIGVLLEIKKDQRSRWSFPGATGEFAPPMNSRIVIFQDGSKVAEVSKEMPQEDRCPHGVLDLCGNVAKVRLQPNIIPPE